MSERHWRQEQLGAHARSPSMVGVGRHQLLGRSRGQGQRGRQGSEGDSLEPRTWTPLLSQSRRWIGRLGLFGQDKPGGGRGAGSPRPFPCQTRPLSSSKSSSSPMGIYQRTAPAGSLEGGNRHSFDTHYAPKAALLAFVIYFTEAVGMWFYCPEHRNGQNSRNCFPRA